MHAAVQHHVARRSGCEPLEALSHVHLGRRMSRRRRVNRPAVSPPGYDADFTVLDRDPFADGAFLETRVLATWSGGVRLGPRTFEELRTFAVEGASPDGAKRRSTPLFLTLEREPLYMTLHSKLMAVVASAGLLASLAPAFAASPAAMASAAPKSTPCHAANGQFTKCGTAPAASTTTTKDKNGKCHDANGKFTPCPAASPSAMKHS